MQLTVIVDKLKNAFGVEVNLTNPKIAYRETVKGTASVQGKHKKQSGGAGQYGDVHIRFEPCEENFIFADLLDLMLVKTHCTIPTMLQVEQKRCYFWVDMKRMKLFLLLKKKR